MPVLDMENIDLGVLIRKSDSVKKYGRGWFYHDLSFIMYSAPFLEFIDAFSNAILYWYDTMW